MTTNSNQDLIESLQKQRQSLKRQLDAETDELMSASGSNRVRREAERDRFANQLQEIDERISKLRQVVQENATEALISILKTFTDDARLFLSAYQRALLERTVTPDLDDIESLIRHLASDLNEPSANRTLYRFVVYSLHLSNQLKLPFSVVESLKQWVKANIPELSPIKAEVEREQAERSKQKSCLLIKVYSSSIDEYHIKAWYISDRQNYRQNWPEGAKPVQVVDSERNAIQAQPMEEAKTDSNQEKIGKPPYPAVKIKIVIQQIHQQCCQVYDAPELVEIFLPRQLMNSDIDSWQLQEKRRPLFGTRYPVILRSSDRLTDKYLRKPVQKEKWTSVERLLKAPAMPAFCEGDPNDINELYVQGETYSVPDKPETKNIVGLKLTRPSSVADEDLDDLFETVLMDSALPIMIWARQPEVGLDCSASINQILGCALEQLPEDLKSHRLEAFSTKQKNQGCHIGNHLSLLWDDPQLIPPDSE